jgi:signal transduction histidine kinase
MPRRGSFERRLLVALVLFSLVPSLALLGTGTLLLSEAVELNTSPATWAGVRRSGLELLERAERSGDPGLAAAAARHREVLTASLQQSRRWEFLSGRALRVIPVVALLLAALLVGLAFRIARGIARELARPIRELVGWAGIIAREEPLPPGGDAEPARGEMAVLHDAFRAMAAELEASRTRALEAERTRAWITVARGVAHELKNSLAPLRLAVRALERQTRGLPSAREPLEVVASESERLEELARSFAQFGHLPEGPVSEIDLCEQLDYLLRTHLPPGVDYRLRAPVDLPRVQGHHDALARAFANLLLNAAEAMGDRGGTVTVKMTTVGDAVEVRVLDSGPGIAEEILDHLWDPGFTTKSRGTGLGLALVRQTVQAHGGGVWARNRPEGGAEFRVVVPVSYQLSAIGYQPTAHSPPSEQDAGPAAVPTDS